MNLEKALAAIFVVLALTGCVPLATGQGAGTYPTYSDDRGADIRGGSGSGGGGGM